MSLNSVQQLTDARGSLDQWLAYIELVHPVGWDLGLTRVTKVAQQLGILTPAPTTVLVAGTNGKGSTCEYLQRFAMANEMSVGKSTSPHLHRFNERIAYNGEPVADKDIVHAFEEIEASRKNITLTYFEFSVLASLFIFLKRKVDVAILEIGLGGRLDAMNIVEPDLTIITSISLDHQTWLGNTREEIGREKSGIMRRGVSCVVADRNPPASILESALGMDVPLYRIGVDFDRLQGVATSLPQDSFDAARQAANLMGWDVSKAPQIAENTSLAGRRTLLKDKCDVLLDVAHNPAAALSLAEHLETRWEGRDIHAVMGMYKDKDIEGVTRILLPLFKSCHLSSLNELRAEHPDEFLERLPVKHAESVNTYDTIVEAFESAKENAESGDLILVCGSFFIVAEVLRLINRLTVSKK